MYLFSGRAEPAQQGVQKLNAEVDALRDELAGQRTLVNQLTSQLQQVLTVQRTSAGAETGPKADCQRSIGAWQASQPPLPRGPSARFAMPSLPSTPCSQWNLRHDDFENMSLYSQATTAASQPAAYLGQVERGQARKLGNFQGWGMQVDAPELAPELHLPGCEGVMGLESLMQVRAAVGKDMLPWLHALMDPPAGETGDLVVAEGADLASKASGDMDKKSDKGDKSEDLDIRRASRDQVNNAAAAAAAGAAMPAGAAKLAAAAGAVAARAGDVGGTQHSPQLLACVALMAACKAEEGARVRVLDAGALPHVVRLMVEGGEGATALRRVAAHLLWYLSRSPAAADALSDPTPWSAFLPAPEPADGAPPAAVLSAGGYVGRVLVEVLGASLQDDAPATYACARALTNLAAQNDDVRLGAAAAGVVGVLSSLMTSGDSVGAEAAASALLALTAGEEGDESPGAALVCEQVVVVPGALKACLSALRYSDPLVQDSLAGVMQNVTMSVVGTHRHAEALVASGCIAVLLEVARCGGYTTQEGTVSALGNLATDEAACHDALVAGGSVEILSYFITQQLPHGADPTATLAAAHVQSTAMMCMRNLCTGRVGTKQALIDRGGAAACLTASQGTGGAFGAGAGASAAPSDDEIQEELDEHHANVQSWALSALLSLSTEPSLREPLVARCRVAPPLLGVLLGGAPQAKELAAKVLTNLSIPDACKGLLVSQGAAMVLVPLVRTGTRAGRQAACRALYNLAKLAANRLEIAACGAVPALLEALVCNETPVFEAAAAALHGICNHLQVMEMAVTAGGARVLLSTVRQRHFAISSRGSKLLLRLLQRMALLHPCVQEEVVAEVSSLGLI